MTPDLDTTVLITGASGFLGSALVWRLNQLGYTNLTLVDRLGKTDKWRNLVGLRYTEYLEADAFADLITEIGDKDRYPTCPWSVIYHFGACSSTRETDAGYLMRNNYDWSITLADYAHQHGVRFIYASSAATYGNGPMDDSLAPCSLRPRNAYALSKNAFDQYAANAGWLDSMVGLKFFNVVGANSRHKGIMTDFIAKTYDQVKETGVATLYDTHLHAPEGKDARDFLYVKDAVDMAIHFVFGAGKDAAGLFNIGSGIATSWTDVAKMVIEAMSHNETFDRGCAIGVEYKPLPPDLAPKFQYYTCADITRLRESGYDKPITPIADAIRDYVTNYLTPDLRLGERS